MPMHKKVRRFAVKTLQSLEELASANGLLHDVTAVLGDRDMANAKIKNWEV